MSQYGNSISSKHSDADANLLGKRDASGEVVAISTNFATTRREGVECPDCNAALPWPRKIRWPEVPAPFKDLEKIPPTTFETIVPYQNFSKDGKPHIHPKVFQHLSFTLNGNLATGMRYNQDTGFTDAEANSAQSHRMSGAAHDNYARLVTLNSWYSALLQCLISTGLAMVDIQGNFMLAAALLSDYDLIQTFGIRTRLAFMLGLVLLLFFAMYIAFREANLQWRLQINPRKGDLIAHLNRSGRLETFIAMVLLEFFCIEKDVRNVVIDLHPWKAVQGFAAFKSEGHRAFLIGYRSKTMYRVENMRGIWRNLPQQLLLKSFSFGFKLYFIYGFYVFNDQHKISYTLILACLTSSVSISYGTFRLVLIWRARQEFWSRLIRRLQADDNEEFQASDMQLLATHFNLYWDDKAQKARSLKRSKVATTRWSDTQCLERENSKVCKTCGKSCRRNGSDQTEEGSDANAVSNTPKEEVNGSEDESISSVHHGSETSLLRDGANCSASRAHQSSEISTTVAGASRSEHDFTSNPSSCIEMTIAARNQEDSA